MKIQIVSEHLNDSKWIISCSLCGPIGISGDDTATPSAAHLASHSAKPAHKSA